MKKIAIFGQGRKVRDYIFEKCIFKRWYPALAFFLAFADIFILVVPLNVVTVTTLIKRERHWFRMACLMACGSTLGAAVLLRLLTWNQPWVEMQFPQLFASEGWQTVKEFLDKYGEWTVLLGTIMQLPLTPFILVPALAGVASWRIISFFFVGNIIKNSIVARSSAYVGSKLRKTK